MTEGMQIPFFSFLVPTRDNVSMLGDFLDSILKTAEQPESVEVVLCVDRDDHASLAYRHPRIPCVKTIVARGTSMGTMNNRCCETSAGRYLMLLNDDVLLRTPGWDSRILEMIGREPDPHVLIHVNDMIFGASLCTFPMISRRTLDLIGMIPEQFRRYAIDDFLFDIFHILRYLGHDRIRYCEHLVFEHLNYQWSTTSDDIRRYTPKTSPEADWRRFHELLPRRKRAALKIALDIDGDRRNEKRYIERLEQIGNDKGYRKTAVRDGTIHE